jgi:hypothetical protein
MRGKKTDFQIWHESLVFSMGRTQTRPWWLGGEGVKSKDTKKNNIQWPRCSQPGVGKSRPST